MIVFDSRKVRYVIGRLEAGERVHDALRTLAEEQGIATAWVAGLGAFRWLELAEYDQEAQEYRPARRIDTPCEILALNGNLSFRDGAPFAHVHVTVSREVGDRIEVLGGHLVDGEVFACELRLEVFDDLLLDRAHDVVTGLALWTEEPLAPGRGRGHGRASDRASDRGLDRAPTGAAHVTNASSAAGAAAEDDDDDGAPAISWASVAEASAAPPPEPRVERRRAAPRPAPRVPDLSFVATPIPEKRRATADDILDEPIPERGDWVDHKVFGLCRVDGEDAEGSLIIRLPNGRRKPIRLDYLEVQPAREDGDRRIYPLVPRKR